MRNLLLLLIIAFVTFTGSSSFGATFTIAPGTHRFGAGSATLNSTVTVTLSGSTSGSAFVYFTMDGRLQIALPPGITGTCSGAPCSVFTGDGQGTGLYNAGSNAFPASIIPGNSFAVDAVFSTSASGTNPVTVWDDAALFQYGGPSTFELGTKLYADSDGYILGVRFHKPPTDSSTSHKVSLWDTNGNLLASVTSSSETASGWQTVLFSSPVAITANSTVIASYYTTQPFWYNANLLRNRNYGTGLLHAVAGYVASNGSCNVNDNWPADAAGRPAAGLVGCVQISNGGISSVTNADATFSAFASEGCQCMIGGIGPGPYKFQNNFVSAVGLPWHHDDSGHDWATRGDYTYYRNTFLTPFTRMYGHPQSDGLRYMHRQPLEWKSGQRISLVGNIFDGSWVEDNPTAATITLTSVAGQGITDVNVESNTFRHVPGVMSTSITVDGGFPLTKPTLRFRFANNLAYDVNQSMTYWVNAGFPSSTGWVLLGPAGSEDVIVDHNSIIGNVGRVPSVMHMYETRTEGVSVTNNILYLSGGNPGLTQDGGIINSACSGTGKVLADCMFQGSYRWDHNLLLGDSSQATIQSYWPSLVNYIPSNPSNLSGVGWFSLNTNNFHLKGGYCSGCGNPASDGKDVGADIDQLEAAQGAVKLVGVPQATLTGTSATISFVAPDSQACSVDVSATDATLINSFSRWSDLGGARNRSVSITGLTPHTVYYYRVNCAVEQPTGEFRTK